jgi:hypothetical protein
MNLTGIVLLRISGESMSRFFLATIKSSGTKSKIPQNYTLEDMFAIDTYKLQEGILVKKASETHPDANKRKIIIANKRGFKGAFIDEGKLSLTGNHKFYILGDKLELIQKIYWGTTAY